MLALPQQPYKLVYDIVNINQPQPFFRHVNPDGKPPCYVMAECGDHRIIIRLRPFPEHIRQPVNIYRYACLMAIRKQQILARLLAPSILIIQVRLCRRGIHHRAFVMLPFQFFQYVPQEMHVAFRKFFRFPGTVHPGKEKSKPTVFTKPMQRLPPHAPAVFQYGQAFRQAIACVFPCPDIL